MSWNLTLGDRIGVDLPFTEPPELPVPIDVLVDFPDADLAGVYVFPALYYELDGPGIDPAPRLLSQNSTGGGTVSVEPGAIKLRVYLRYDALPGPLGTLPHGDIRKSLMTIKAGGGLSIPSLGTRVYELILDTSSTRITMIEGTVLGTPFTTVPVGLSPLVTVSAYNHVDGEFTFYWGKMPLIEPPEQDLLLRYASYQNQSSTLPIAMYITSIATATNAGVYHHPSLNVPGGAVKFFAQDQNNVLAELVPSPGSTIAERIVPAGTKALFQRGRIATTVHDDFMSNLATNPVGSCFFRYQLSSRSNTPAGRGKNWRLPDYTFVKASFTGQSKEDAPWFNEVSGWGV